MTTLIVLGVCAEVLLLVALAVERLTTRPTTGCPSGCGCRGH